MHRRSLLVAGVACALAAPLHAQTITTAGQPAQLDVRASVSWTWR
jgi:hypothetical protein